MVLHRRGAGVAGAGLDQEDAGDHHAEADRLVQADAFAQPGHADRRDQDDANAFPERVGDSDGDALDRQGEEEIGQADHPVHQQHACDRGVGGGQFHRGGADHFGADSQ